MLPEPDLFGNTTSTGCSSHDPLCGGITSNIGKQIFRKIFCQKKVFHAVLTFLTNSDRFCLCSALTANWK